MDNYSFIVANSNNSVKHTCQTESHLKIQLIQIAVINNDHKWDTRVCKKNDTRWKKWYPSIKKI